MKRNRCRTLLMVLVGFCFMALNVKGQTVTQDTLKTDSTVMKTKNDSLKSTIISGFKKPLQDATGSAVGLVDTSIATKAKQQFKGVAYDAQSLIDDKVGYFKKSPEKLKALLPDSNSIKKLKKVRSEGSISVGGAYNYQSFENSTMPAWDSWLEVRHKLTYMNLPIITNVRLSRELIQSGNPFACFEISFDYQTFLAKTKETVQKKAEAEWQELISPGNIKLEAGSGLLQGLDGNLKNMPDKALTTGKDILIKYKVQVLDSMRNQISSTEFLNSYRNYNDSLTVLKNKAVKTAEDSAKIDRITAKIDTINSKKEAYAKEYGELKKMASGGGDLQDGLMNRLGDLNTSDGIQKFMKNRKMLTPKLKMLLNLKTLAIGRANINYTEFTLQNTTITGVHVEYESPIVYAAIAGGYSFNRPISLFNPRTYDGSGRSVVSARAGYGRFSATHIHVTMARISDEKVSTQFQPINFAFPVSNYILGAEYRQNIGKEVYFNVEFAKSVIVRKSKKDEFSEFRYSGFNGTQRMLYNAASKVEFTAAPAKWGTVIRADLKYIPDGFVSLGNPGLRRNVWGSSLSVNQQIDKLKATVSSSLRYESNKTGMNLSGQLPYNDITTNNSVSFRPGIMSISLAHMAFLRRYETSEMGNFTMHTATVTTTISKQLRKVNMQTVLNYMLLCNINQLPNAEKFNHTFMANYAVSFKKGANVSVMLQYNSPKPFTSVFNLMSVNAQARIPIGKFATTSLGAGYSLSQISGSSNLTGTAGLQMRTKKSGAFELSSNLFFTKSSSVNEVKMQPRVFTTAGWTYNWNR